MIGKNEVFYNQLFQNDHSIMLLIDPITGCIIDANPAASKFYGWPIDKLKTSKIWEINTLPEEAVKEQMRLALSQNKNYFNFQHLLSSGEIRDIEVYCVVVCIDSRRLLFSNVIDVTNRVNAQKEAKRHFEFERTILHLAQNFINMPLDKLDEAVNAAIALIVDYCGARRATLWKYDWSKKISVKLYEFDKEPQVGAKLDFIPIDHFSDELEYFKRGEVRLLKYDEDESCKRYFLQTGIRSTLIVPLNVKDELIGTFTVSLLDAHKQWGTIEINTVRIFTEMLTNILQRKERAQALCESIESHRITLDSVKDCIIMVNREGDILSVNTTFVHRFNTSKHNSIGKNLSEFLPRERYGDLYDRRMACVRKAFDTCKLITIEDSRDGIYFENRFYPVLKDGKATAVTLFSSDISDRKKAEEDKKSKVEYQTKLKVMTEFFTNISHEFKTPLSLILLQHELMELYIRDDKNLQKLLSVAQQSSYRLARLVGNLLDITKIDAGYMDIKLETVDMEHLVKEICDSVDIYVKAKSIHLKFKCTLSNVYLATDKDKLERILFNLLSNAIKYTEKKGCISVWLMNCKDRGARIIVEDTGEGIPKEKQKRIFDRFAQIDTSFNRLHEGTGIGLSLVKSLVQMLNGTVRVKSELKKGSKFIVELPMMPFNPDASVIRVDGYNLRKKAEMELADLYLKGND